MPYSLPSPEALRQLQEEAAARNLGPRVAQRLGWFLYRQEKGCSIISACKHFGIGRATFYRALWRFDPLNLAALDDCSRRPHTPRGRAGLRTLPL